MLRFQVLTLFPELISAFSEIGLVSRGIKESLLSIEPTQLRDFAINTHGQVDDTPYGGGSGMVLRVEPAYAAVRKAKEHDPKAKVLLFSPRGKPFNQQRARDFAERYVSDGGGYILLCSRYEGVDERVVEHLVDEEISLGDYLLMGGELAAMCFIEAVGRLIPGVLGNPESLASESFTKHLLEYPHYTKPSEFEGMSVPPVLLSGNHQQINTWRAEQSIEATVKRRPDLVDAQGPVSCDVSLALVHHPVVDKNGAIITSSITTLDLHDIARTSRTYGVTRFYAAHPVKMMRRIAEKVCEHWESGFGLHYNPNRKDALTTLSIVSDLDDIIIDIEQRTGKLPKLIATSAKRDERNVSFAELRARLRVTEVPHLILFGTGWGLHREILDRADYLLEPIVGPTDYNHLSVRAAVAIIIDRLLAERHIS